MTPEEIKIIREFVEGTEEWTYQMHRMQQDKACVICGIIPEKLRELAEAVKKLMSVNNI